MASQDILALTPPMGWNSYNTFNCEPNEELIMEVAKGFVETGLKEAGYTYINIDDGWMAPTRDGQGNLVAHPDKFPHGLKKITDYIHSLGLKAGIYLGAGLKTYGEYPGSLGFEARDAALIAEWGFDLLKYDYRELPDDPPNRDVISEYRYMASCLQKTGRPLLFSICEHGRSRPWLWGKGVGQMWRTTPDIKDGFDGDVNWGWGINKIITQTHHLYPYAGPGHWNDPDMLVIGLKGRLSWQGPGCTEEEYKTHFALWCLLAAPLLIGCDVRNLENDTANILLNKELIAINQDRLGIQARIVRQEVGYSIWRKELAGGAVAMGVYNLFNQPKTLELLREDTGFAPNFKATLRDLVKGEELGELKDVQALDVAPHGCAVLKVTPV